MEMVRLLLHFLLCNNGFFFYHCCVYLYAFAGLPIIQLLKWIHMKLKKEENDSGYK